MSAVFDEATQPTIDQFVGEGKKFTSVEDFVKSYATSQQFIEQLKTENQGIREELGQRVGAEDLFKKIVERTPEPATTVVTAPKEHQPVGEPNQEVDLAQRIREELDRARTQESQTTNAGIVINRLVELYGSEDKAGEYVRTKAAELGVTTKYLQDLAVQAPKAFFAAVGISSSNPASVPAPRGEVNTAALRPTENGASTYGTKAYFDQMRRDDPNQYWQPSVQNAIFKAAKEGLYKTD